MPDRTPEGTISRGAGGLLVTKLRPPQPPAGFVARPRLMDRLDGGLARELTLVCAPAGFGKTSLLAEWSQRGERPVGWQRIARGGELPLNTHGGQLSAGRLHGYGFIHEAVLQLRGSAGARQVSPQPEVAVVSNGGGPIAGCLLLTRLA